MTQSFNLLNSPWVPCVQQDGTLAELSLRDVLVRAHALRELSGESPLIVAALYRLLLAVLHRVFGPASLQQWERLWQAGQWDATELDAYFDRWQNRFDLFDARRPFYQFSDPRVRPKSVASLILDVASGNNATLFDHHTDDGEIALDPAEAARVVVAAQAFGLAGLSGLPEKFTDAPCTRGILFLVQGSSLFETLALNLIRYPDDAVMPHRPDDCPSWEMDDPFTPDRSVPKGYLDYLTWQNRRILLIPEEFHGQIVIRQATVAPALRLAGDILDPMKHYRRDEGRGWVVLRFLEDRALWRDSAALFRLHDPGHRPPRVFDWLASLVDAGCLDRHRTRRYLALGMANDQAKVDFYRSERMPLPLEYLSDDSLVEQLTEALDMAERAARQLWGAVHTLAVFLLSPRADAEGTHPPQRRDLDGPMRQWGAETRYWSSLEIPFRTTMQSLPRRGEAALADWRTMVFRVALSAFDQVARTVGHSARTFRAEVQARDQLLAGLAKAMPVPTEGP